MRGFQTKTVKSASKEAFMPLRRHLVNLSLTLGLFYPKICEEKIGGQNKEFIYSQEFTLISLYMHF